MNNYYLLILNLLNLCFLDLYQSVFPNKCILGETSKTVKATIKNVYSVAKVSVERSIYTIILLYIKKIDQLSLSFRVFISYRLHLHKMYGCYSLSNF